MSKWCDRSERWLQTADASSTEAAFLYLLALVDPLLLLLRLPSHSSLIPSPSFPFTTTPAAFFAQREAASCSQDVEKSFAFSFPEQEEVGMGMQGHDW